MNSSQWEVVCEFVLEWIQYCIQRTIKKTKTGESVASKFWMKPFVSWTSQDEVVEYLSVSPFELPSGYVIAEFKNETDLQKNLDELIPPKEVFLGTYFLLQDSDNIFELPPKERLEIFKHVFWLLGIDESKDKIAEEKREIGAIIKSRADMTQYDMKLKPLLDRLIILWSQLQIQWERYKQDTTAISHRSSFVSEQELLQGKIIIEHLALPERLDISPLREAILSYQQRHTELQTTLRSVQGQEQSLQIALSSLRQQLSTKTKESDDIQVQLDRYSDSLFQEVTNTLQAKQNQRWEYINSIDLSQEFTTVQKLWHEAKTQELRDIFTSLRGEGTTTWQSTTQDLDWFVPRNDSLLGIPSNESSFTLIELRSIIQACIVFGKDAKYQLTAREDKKVTLNQRLQDLDIQILQSTKTIQEFEQTINTNAQFHCDKIDGSCPYVEMINTATFKTLRNQLATMTADQERIQSQKIQLTNDLTTLTSDITIKQLADDAEIAKKTLISSQRKLREEQITVLTTIDKEITLLQSQRSQLQQQQATTLKLREQLITLQSEKTSLTQQITETTASLESIETQITTLRTQLQELISLNTIEEDVKTLAEFEQLVDRLTILLQEFKENQLLIKQLKEKEKILSDLYLVFSKELLLIVVQSNLPQIQDLMNMYLSQVVDYQLVMDIDKKSTSTESLELFVTIKDRLGIREVWSLSWWQKVILKLVWMMAISVITRSQMLFLDETINNLDGDTVARVADLLTNFIKGKGDQFQFYVVTHSHQIQDMGIRDGVIEIGK